MLKQLVTEEQAASTLGISIDELRSMRDAGAGPDHFELSVRVVRYDVEDVAAWVQQSTEKGQTPSGPAIAPPTIEGTER